MNILFLCVGNSARSQMAEGRAKEMLPTKFTIKSAGSSPSGFIHEGAFSIMKEIGIDISKQTSKGINDLDKEFINNLDCIITLCAEEICPTMQNNAMKKHWPIPDPSLENISKDQQKILFRRTRENIFIMLKKFFTDVA